MLQTILVPVSIVTGAGLIAGLLLSVASKFFAVEVDERVTKLREVLPGANCGACGCAGCDEYAAKMAAGEAEPNLCPVGGAAVAAKLGEILGVSVGSIEPKRAVVRCRGHLQTSEYIMDYDGPKTCQAAKLFYNGRTSCNFACLGYGDCVNACEYDAIQIVDHIATGKGRSVYRMRSLCKGLSKRYSGNPSKKPDHLCYLHEPRQRRRYPQGLHQWLYRM